MSSEKDQAFDVATTLKQLEGVLAQFKQEVAVLQERFETALRELQRKGYKIDESRISEFMKSFWHTYPTRSANEWEWLP